MNKVIDGKKYNTESAKQLASWENMSDTRNFEYVYEALYRTKSGNYFLHGKGGGNSRYGEWHGNSGGPGEAIITFTESEAREWAGNHVDADKYEEIFGRIKEGLVTFAMQVPPSVRDRFQKLKSARGLTAGELLEDLLPKK
jgi:hypothetical protein